MFDFTPLVTPIISSTRFTPAWLSLYVFRACWLVPLFGAGGPAQALSS